MEKYNLHVGIDLTIGEELEDTLPDRMVLSMTQSNFEHQRNMMPIFGPLNDGFWAHNTRLKCCPCLQKTEIYLKCYKQKIIRSKGPGVDVSRTLQTKFELSVPSNHVTAEQGVVKHHSLGTVWRFNPTSRFIAELSGGQDGATGQWPAKLCTDQHSRNTIHPRNPIHTSWTLIQLLCKTGHKISTTLCFWMLFKIVSNEKTQLFKSSWMLYDFCLLLTFIVCFLNPVQTSVLAYCENNITLPNVLSVCRSFVSPVMHHYKERQETICLNYMTGVIWHDVSQKFGVTQLCWKLPS